jgi:sodium/hydrogen antiporter
MRLVAGISTTRIRGALETKPVLGGIKSCAKHDGAPMTFLGWMSLVGALLLAMALSSASIRRLPISTAAIYLGIGCAIGPWGFDLLRIDLDAVWFERLTEIAVILSLFIGGLRLRLPLTHPAWRAAYWLASVVMLATIAAVALFAACVLDLDPALALLIGAILAPTDPVLASAVTVGHSQDHDRLRYALSGEAGLNDGAAFPFVVVALLWLDGIATGELAHWAGHRLLWAVPAGLAIGYGLGHLVGSAAIRLRARNRDTAAPSDFLALALIALSYTVAEQLGAWGFLSVFAAGLGLRRTEVRTVKDDPHPDAASQYAGDHPPAETLVEPNQVTEQELGQPAVAAGVMVAEVISFGDTLERILEVLLVVLVGMTLASYWDWRGVWLSLALIGIIRPLCTQLFLIGSGVGRMQKWLIGWFGIRGIGSLYYLAYAMTHGLSQIHIQEVAGLILTVVAASIVIHGLSGQLLMQWYNRSRALPGSDPP